MLKQQLENIGMTGELVRLPDFRGIKCWILHKGFEVEDVSAESFIEVAELAIKIKNNQTTQ